MFDALLFDLDGTLVDTIPFWVEANVQALADRGAQVDPESFLTDCYQEALHFHGILEYAGVSTRDEEDWYAARDDRYVDILQHKGNWLSDALEALQSLPDDLPLGLMTGSKRRFVYALNRRLHLTDIFDAVVTQDDTGMRMKPDPYGLLLLAQQLHVDPTHCIYIGDQRIDLQAAQAAGMSSCLIPGPHSRPHLDNEVDRILQSIAQISQLLS